MSKAYIVYEDYYYSQDVDGYWLPNCDKRVVGVFTTKESGYSAIREAAMTKAVQLIADGKYESKKEDSDGWQITINVTEDSSQLIDEESYFYYCEEITLDTIIKDESQ